AVVAAFGYLQVGVVPGRQLDALRRHQVDIGVVLDVGRRGVVDGAHHFFVLLGAGNGQYGRVHVADDGFFDPHAAGDDDAAVLGDGLADGVQRFGLGAVDKAAGVDNDHIGVVVFGCNRIALGAQLGKDALGIDQRFGTTQADKAHFFGTRFGEVRFRAARVRAARVRGIHE